MTLPDYQKQTNRPGTSRPERFWSKVSVRDANNCWEWRSSTSNGYGRFDERINGLKVHAYAHTVAWELHTRRAVQTGKRINQTCGNRRCCNPQHLEEVHTDAKPIARKLAEAGRRALTMADAEAIRQLHAVGFKVAQLARKYGRSVDTIRSIIKGRTWKSKQ